MTSKEAASKRIRELEEELEGHRKKAKSTSDSVAAEYTCSLSLELFVDPVRAEDTFDYERAEIERVIKHQGKNLTSPQTGKTMGSTLTPSYNVKNAVEALVTTGTISGELAETYRNSKLVMETKQKAEDGDAKSMELLADWYKVGRNGLSKSQALSDEWRERAEKADDDEYITELKAAASAGDAAAMYNLGNAYENGLRGLAEDEEKAFEWYSKAADGMDTAGIAMKAYFLVNGHGGAEVNVAYGTSQMFYAAGAGSDLASREVGIWYLHGMHGIPENKAKARYFLDRATNGLCAELHMKPADLDEAKQLLNQLDLQREEEDTDPLPPTSPSIGGRPMKKKSSRRTQGAALEKEEDAAFSLPLSSALPNIVSKKEDGMSPSYMYEGKRVAKHYGGEFKYGTVIEHEVNGKSALIRFDGGDFDIVYLPELKNIVQLHNEEKGADDIIRADSKKRGKAGGRYFLDQQVEERKPAPRAKSNKSGRKIHRGREWTSELEHLPSKQARRSKDKRGMNRSGGRHNQWKEKDPNDMTMDDHEEGSKTTGTEPFNFHAKRS